MRFLIFSFGILALVATTGCSKNGSSDLQYGTNTGFCKGGTVDSIEGNKSESANKIVNGVVTTNFPYVVKVRFGNSSCTGSFVSDTTLLTAAHCREEGYAVYGSAVEENSVKLHVGTDIAVIVFKAKTYSGEYAKIVTTAPKVGDALTLVGYGQTDLINNNRSDGQKRVGCNSLMGFGNVTDKQISDTTDKGNYIHYRSPVGGMGVGQPSMTGRGDSGGPIFDGTSIVAVTSFGNTKKSMMGFYTFLNDPSPDANALYEYDTNLFSRINVDLMKKAVNEINANIPNLDALDKLVN